MIKKSEHEPICEALKRGSQKRCEALVDHDADGMNEKIDVISHYINSEYLFRSINSKVDSYNRDSQYSGYNTSSFKMVFLSCEHSIKKYNKMIERVQRDLNHANAIYKYYSDKYNAICNATRRDILNNISHFESLGSGDKNIDQREFYIDWTNISALAL